MPAYLLLHGCHRWFAELLCGFHFAECSAAAVIYHVGETGPAGEAFETFAYFQRTP